MCGIFRTFAAVNVSFIIMTAVELRRSIIADLDQMSLEMMESVSNYVKRLRRRSRSIKRDADAQSKREAAMLFVKNLSVHGGISVPTDERGLDALVDEKYDK